MVDVDGTGSNGAGPVDVDGASSNGTGPVDGAGLDGVGPVDVDGAGSVDSAGSDGVCPVDGARSEGAGLVDVDGTGPVGINTPRHSASNFTNSLPSDRCLYLSNVLHTFWTWYLYDERSPGTTSFKAVSVREITRSCSLNTNNT